MYQSTSIAVDDMEKPTPNIEFRGVTKTYAASPHAHTVFQGLSLCTCAPEVMVLLGDNGCGKTTILRLAAGTELPDSGSVIRRNTEPVGWMPQDYSTSLLPWATVRRNTLLPLEFRGVPTSEANSRLAALLDELSFGEIRLDAYPHELSGGQRQRVALIRALLIGASLVLLDEPFTSLDTPTLDTLLPRLRIHLRNKGATALVVLHDVDQALLLADRVVVLGGRPSSVTFDCRLSAEVQRESDWLFTPELIDVRKRVLAARRLCLDATKERLP